jgi:hypothetical protein
LQAVELCKRRYYGEAACQQLVLQIQAYAAGAAPYNQPFFYGAGFNVRNWWRAAAISGHEMLVGLAIVLLDIVPHAAEPERCFSLMGWYSSGRRARTSVKTMAMMATIKMHYEQQAPPAAPQPSKPVRPEERECIALAEAAAMLPAAEAAAEVAATKLAVCDDGEADLLDATPEELEEFLKELQAADLAQMTEAAGTVGGKTFMELLTEPWDGYDLSAPQLDPAYEGSAAAGPLLGVLGGSSGGGGGGGGRQQRGADFDSMQLVLRTVGKA